MYVCMSMKGLGRLYMYWKHDTREGVGAWVECGKGGEFF